MLRKVFFSVPRRCRVAFSRTLGEIPQAPRVCSGTIVTSISIRTTNRKVTGSTPAKERSDFFPSIPESPSRIKFHSPGLTCNISFSTFAIMLQFDNLDARSMTGQLLYEPIVVA